MRKRDEYEFYPANLFTEGDVIEEFTCKMVFTGKSTGRSVEIEVPKPRTVQLSVNSNVEEDDSFPDPYARVSPGPHVISMDLALTLTAYPDYDRRDNMIAFIQRNGE